MTIGLDGLMDSPDAKSLFKSGGKTKVHPKMDNQSFDDYGTNDKLGKDKTKEKPKLNDYESGANANIVPGSGKHETRSKFSLRESGEESKTGLQTQESVFDDKKKSAGSESGVFKGKYNNK